MIFRICDSKGMHKLFPYQEQGIKYLSGRKHALLADEMGLGKTVQAIRGLDAILAKTAIVICPSVARINWLREFEMWGQISRNIVIMEQLSDMPPQDSVIICSFDYATRNFEKLKKIGAEALILDEAQYVKTVGAKRTTAIMGKNGVLHSVKRAWFLSGTPAPNHPGELWVLLFTFGVTKMAHDAFIEKYCTYRKTTYGVQITGANRAKIPELKLLLKDVMLRRLKKDVMKELPHISYTYEHVLPGRVAIEDQASFMDYFVPTDRRAELKEKLQKEAELLRMVFDASGDNADAKFKTLEGVQQSVSTLRRFIGLQKVEPVVELVRSAFQNHSYKKVVLFAVHRDVIEGLRVGLQEFHPVVIYGGTDPKKRQRNIDRFQKYDKYKIFIGNIQAAGTAITLTAAHHVLFVEQDWVPGNNAQAVMRVHRIGQENNVSVRFVTIDKTLDTRIAYLLRKKTEELTEIFD
jgi:SNF2 family DNA or RNA helicase